MKKKTFDDVISHLGFYGEEICVLDKEIKEYKSKSRKEMYEYVYDKFPGVKCLFTMTDEQTLLKQVEDEKRFLITLQVSSLCDGKSANSSLWIR